jgi:cytochrome c
MNLRMIFPGAAAMFMMAIAGSSLAADSSGAEEAKDLLNKAVAYLEKEGPAKAFCAFNDRHGAFHKGPLYVFAINMDGVYFAHSAAPSLVGVSLRDTRDAAGQPVGKLVMDAIATKDEGSVDYMWLNYATNKVEKKRSFVKRVGELFVVGVGYYTAP